LFFQLDISVSLASYRVAIEASRKGNPMLSANATAVPSGRDACSSSRESSARLHPDERPMRTRELLRLLLADLAGLTSLETYSRKISNPTRLEYCGNLTSLDLSGSLVSDISPL